MKNKQHKNQAHMVQALRLSSPEATPSIEFINALTAKLDTSIGENSELNYKKIKLEDFNDVSYIVSGSGAPIIFLHAVGETPSAYKKLISLLSKTNRVYAPTLPGHSKTIMPKWFRSKDPNEALNNYVVFLKRFIEGLNLNDKLTLIGHSLGGTIGIKYTYLYPENIKELVLADAFTEPVDFGTVRSIINGMKVQLDLLLNHKRIIPFGLFSTVRNLKSLIYSLNLLSKIDLSNELKRIKSKTRIYWGEKDFL